MDNLSDFVAAPPTGDDEIFTLMRWRWNVTRAWQLFGDQEPLPVPVAPLARMLGLIRIDEAHAATVDVSRPLLLVCVPEGEEALVPIDGWHRIHRGEAESMSELPAIVLTREQAAQVLL